MRLEIQTKNFSYPVRIGVLEPITHASKVLVVSDSIVAPLHLDTLLSKLQASKIFTHEMPSGEEHKTWEGIESILESAFEANLSRKDLMLALGGGVVSDMVGFASAIYKRGIAFEIVPTTLLAQVDASVGGKTGINNAYGKNLIGAFHPPRAVHIDPQFLKTLPQREFKAGIAEMIKKAVCFNKDYFEWLEKHPLEKHLSEGIYKSVAIKAEVVAKDEREEGLRMGLNYGHTFAHAIEKVGRYSTHLHGEAVAIGIQMANALACYLGLLDNPTQERIKALLKTYGLNLPYKITDFEGFYKDLQMDKKNNQCICFILPKGLGAFVAREDIDKSTLKEALHAWL
ncbi:3-dehydroquinate synthase AroB [Helicobacter sp. NHP19-012]|uniref:3-dehydroquinate synthase n=1 Tax=Helicobacter gastrofelis TaxID=2849642 RepID=A0ABN6IBV3_9HELI|nr:MULTISPECIES: 3-dehydroquinate synthase [unclassified Helicobacter]BCZ19618.1 3-dehydroquinate synthase AroB [Helicobacter sp. NHP19-012]GMB96501.1 3-dehydroquinate synthase AroB [Helicobacter sp. NHP22-001]